MSSFLTVGPFKSWTTKGPVSDVSEFCMFGILITTVFFSQNKLIFSFFSGCDEKEWQWFKSNFSSKSSSWVFCWWHATDTSHISAGNQVTYSIKQMKNPKLIFPLPATVYYHTVGSEMVKKRLGCKWFGF